MGKSIAKFIVMSTVCLFLGFVGIWLFNHVNSWIGILWLIAFTFGLSYLWEDLTKWVHKSNNQEKQN
jgi:4-hydroxybenzoate polyprenyltransferase